MLRWFNSFADHGRPAAVVAVSALLAGISLAGITVVYLADQIGGDDGAAVSTGPTGPTVPGIPVPGATAPGSSAPPVTPPAAGSATPGSGTSAPGSSASPFSGGQGVPGGVGSGGGGP